ncbi:MAG: hypothetical protein Q4D15_02240 [Lachnospiraceae bacterium]|nr:hypothetical protein [Lachnospiraceae bacterium]
MKKKFLAIAAIAIMIPLVLCACKKEKPVEPTQPATQEASVEPETKSTPTEDPEAAVVRLIDNVNLLKYVHGVALDCDYDYVWYDENGYAYTMVTDPDFQSIGDIMEYLFDTFTSRGAAEYFPDLALMGQDDAYYPYSYVMVQGDDDVPYGLYELQGWLGFSIYENVRDITISNQTDNSFTADFTVDYFGDWVTLTMGVVGEESNGSFVWKIDSIVENWEY